MTVRLFPEMTAWLFAGRRSLVILPESRPRDRDRELFEVTELVARGPAALVCHPFAVERMLGAAPRAGALPLLATHHGYAVTHVVDLRGVLIPGQASPIAALLVGEEAPTVRVLRCDSAEPRILARPERGRVWRAVASTWDTPGVTDVTTTTDCPRDPAAVLAAFGGPAHE